MYAYVGNDPISFSDPSGQFAIFWHWGITFVAALNSGYSLSQSWSYASAAAGPDKPFSGNTFSNNYGAQIEHALTARTASNYIPPSSVALAGTEVLINRQLQSSSVVEQGRGIHATQDVAATNHAGKPWPPPGGVFGKLWHLVQDVFPSFSSVGTAYDRTIEAFNKIEANAAVKAIEIVKDVFDGAGNRPPDLSPSPSNLDTLTTSPAVGPYTGGQSSNDYVGSLK